MSVELLPFLLVPLLTYTYFWVNPLAFSIFLEGAFRYFTEVYLGYKAIKIDIETILAYRRYKRNAQKLACENGYSGDFVKVYLGLYKAEDWEILRRQKKATHEERFRSFEEELSTFLF